MLVTGGDDQIVRIYTSDGNSVFAYSHEVLLSISITKIHITDDKKYIFVGGLSTTIFILE